MGFEIQPTFEYSKREDGSDLSDNSPEEDNLANWASEQRLEEFAHTGEGKYLTPELAREMDVGEDVMKEVPGATQEDIAYARGCDVTRQKEGQEIIDALLHKHDIDPKSLDSLSDDEFIKKTLSFASIRIDDLSGDDLAYIQGYTQDMLFEKIMDNPTLTGKFFQYVVSQNIDVTLRNMHVLETILERVRLEYLRDDDYLTSESKAAFHVIGEVQDMIKIITAEDPHPESNALAALKFNAFADSYMKKYSGWIDLEQSAPAYIAPGVLMTWDTEKHIPYIYHEDSGFIEGLAEESKKDTVAGKVLRRDVGTMKLYDINRELHAPASYDLNEAMVLIRDSNEELEDYLRENVSNFSKEDFEVFVSLIREGMREGIAKYLGFDQTNLSLKEQWYLFQYLKTVPVKELDDVAELVTNHEIKGLRAFLSMEQGGREMSSSILQIDKNYDQEEAKQIFDTYGRLVDLSNSTADYISEKFSGKKIDSARVQQIAQRGLLRGMALLKQMAQGDYTSEQVSQKLGMIGGELEIVKGVYRELIESGEIRNIQDLELYSARILSGDYILSQQDIIQRMSELIDTEHGATEKSEDLKSELEASLLKKDAKVHLSRIDDVVESFCVTYMIEDGAMHVGGLNVSPAARELKLGPQIIDSILDDADRKKHDLVVEATPEKARIYARIYSFEKVGEEEFSGSQYYILRRKPQSASH